MGTKFPHQIELARYHQMPKDFVGPQEADVLYSTYETLREGKQSTGYLYVAGSAAAESGLMATHLASDERHTRIDAAQEAWSDAQDKFIMRHYLDDWTESKLLSIPDRIQMQRIYCDVYHEMVDSNVRPETMHNLHGSLVRLATANLEQHDAALQAHDEGAVCIRRGLAYELGTLMTITRLKCPSFFAIPATARADHGGFYPEQTHDVRLIQQTWGTIKTCIPYEVKPTNGLYSKRYQSAFVRGRVELLMPSSTEPLDLVRFMKQEHEGTIAPEHLTELNEITSRVLTLAEDYKLKRSLGQSVLAAA